MQDLIKEWFDYADGKLIWKKARKRIVVGAVAGCLCKPSMAKNKPYWRIIFDGFAYPAHRLIWIMHNGEIPDHMLCDHINGDSLDNRIENLRLVSRSENNRNIRLPSNNKSGVVGVRWSERDNRWISAIKVNQKEIHLGCFKVFEDAVNARVVAEKKYNFETYYLNNGQ